MTQEFRAPTGRTLWRYLVNERLDLVDPLACNADIAIIVVSVMIVDTDPQWADETAAYITGHSFALMTSQIKGGLAQTGQLGCD